MPLAPFTVILARTNNSPTFMSFSPLPVWALGPFKGHQQFASGCLLSPDSYRTDHGPFNDAMVWV